MSFRIRLLPAVIFTLVLMLGMKVGGVWQGLSLSGTPVSAAESDAPEPKAETKEETSAEAGTPAAEEKTDEIAAKEPDRDPSELSQEEIDVLQQLLNRRQELDVRAQQLDTREELLMAAERRIDKKIEELKEIQGTIASHLKQHNEEEEAKLKSLVKIYQSMKPKQAARIFERLEMPILLDVVERMKEAKVAPIIAQMDPTKAETVTTELAQRRQLPSPGE
ncbi:MAG: MotE family protein [Alphaproteobacteria bacterium]